MAIYVYKIILTLIILLLQIRTTHASVGGYCRLENRTMVLNLCKNPPRLTLPVCVGLCSSSTRWNFNFKRFVPRISACTVTQHRTEQFVCPDSTHTAIQLIIPLACSCRKQYCRNSHPRHSL